MIQWLALLKLPKEKLEEIVALGDYWEQARGDGEGAAEEKKVQLTP